MHAILYEMCVKYIQHDYYKYNININKNNVITSVIYY